MLAVIEWLSEEQGGRRRPPTADGPMPYMPILRLAEEPWPAPDAWSAIVRRIETLPEIDRWLADVTYRVEEAPHDSLRAGRRFELYEGGRCVARGSLVGTSSAVSSSVRGDAIA